MTATKIDKQPSKSKFCYFHPEGLCTRKCVHFNTCLRNPYRDKKEE